ncbi:DUF2271 domain-containing protein [Paenibacillus caui]|uniref:DUF2271 domain-containing protein n=1 Tax=Paenibacillus caui TaxID=2873927 RepID=UPI001CA805C3|nr:DUF2271 domain-containing protein [Paenibacillus caui]
MKKVLIPVVGTLGAGVIIISGMSTFAHKDNPFSASPPVNLASSGNDASATTSTPSVKTLGLVDIHYQLYHLDRLASNQIAIWIEDSQGNYVKTLRASSFTANGGYRTRPESLPEWREAANWENASENEIKRVSLPEQEPGMHVVYWDCTDESGQAVDPGTYVYKVEGNIFWENRVIYTGEIAVGSDFAGETKAKVEYKPADAESQGTLLENVSAGFKPGASIASAQQEPVTQTRGS